MHYNALKLIVVLNSHPKISPVIYHVFASEVVAPPQRPTAEISYSNPLGSPCTLTGDLHGAIQAPNNRIERLKYQGRLQINTLISVPDSLSAKCVP